MGIFKIGELIDEIRDGVNITIELEDDFTTKLGKVLMDGGGEIPMKIKIDLYEPVDNDE
jgi:hypothetical protein